MSDDEAFGDFIRRVRAGEAGAAGDFVRRYEPTLRLAVHVWLSDPGLRRVQDELDICQSVLADFFIRARAGQFELDRPQQLVKLLLTMAHHQVLNHVKHESAARRDVRRRDQSGVRLPELVAPGPGPCEVAANRELVGEFRRRLCGDERHLAEQRALGRSWKEIAAEVGGSPEGLRMRLTRAVDRVTRALRLE